MGCKCNQMFEDRPCLMVKVVDQCSITCSMTHCSFFVVVCFFFFLMETVLNGKYEQCSGIWGR